MTISRATGHAQEFEVLIAGAGPVGLGLAIALGQRGIRCLVVERRLSPSPIPKGQNLTQRSMEHVHFWGAEQALRAARTIPRDYGIGGLTAYGTLLGDHHYDWLQRELVRPYYFTENERLPQYATEAVLRARLAELPSVETLYGWTCGAPESSQSGVTIALSERSGPGQRRCQAQYVVGCDGSRSAIRAAAGISQSLSDHDRLMALLVFRSTELHELLGRFPGKSFYNVLHPDLKGYWQFFGRVDLGTTWFFHAPVPAGTTAENFDFKSYLRKAVGADFEMEVDHIGLWDLRFATADTYRSGRIFIAGDAAHSHPPYGGYGINTGFEDAANLGWKLAAALRGWAGSGLLDSYDLERRPVFASTARDFIEKSINDDRDFLAGFDPSVDRAAFEARWSERGSGAKAEVAAFEPNYEGSPIVFGPQGAQCSAVGRHQFQARAGHHLAPQILGDDRNIYDALGDGFTLLALDGDDRTIQSFEAAAAVRHIPLNILRETAASGREGYAARYVLVRPDQFVAFACTGEPDDPVAVLSRAAGWLE